MTQILANNYSYDGIKYTKNELIFQFSPNDTFYVPYNKELLLELEKSNKNNVKVPNTGNLPVGFIFPEEYKIQEYCRKHGKIAQEYFYVGKTKMMGKCDDSKLKIRGINDVYCKILKVAEDSRDYIFRDLIVEVSKNNEEYVGSEIHQLRKKMVVNDLEILPYDDYEQDLIDLVHGFEEIYEKPSSMFSLVNKLNDGVLKDYNEKIRCKISTEIMTNPVRFPSSCYPGNNTFDKQQEYVVDRSSAEKIINNNHPETGEVFQMDQLVPADDIKILIDLCGYLKFI